MIQEKDFLYRVPVKTAPITTPKGQIRNPEILVDLEGGEFMHGNILDANSTNKLINQSVKAEQTRAEGKEKEISDKLAIVDGDSNTEGSFRKAIADVIAAAPEDLDTLKEIADKLADSDDLHTALNHAIKEKADASALANEVTRATDAESNLQTAIDAKQDAGNYIPYDNTDMSSYKVDRTIKVSDIITDSTTDSSLNTVLSKKVDTEAFNSFTSSVSGQLNSFNGTLSTFGKQIALKQDKITVNSVDITDIKTDDITKLRTIIKDLIDALSKSGLIRKKHKS